MWKTRARSIPQCIQRRQEAWENRGSIVPDAADAVSHRGKIITIIQMVALNY